MNEEEIILFYEEKLRIQNKEFDKRITDLVLYLNDIKNSEAYLQAHHFRTLQSLITKYPVLEDEWKKFYTLSKLVCETEHLGILSSIGHTVKDYETLMYEEKLNQMSDRIQELSLRIQKNKQEARYYNQLVVLVQNNPILQDDWNKFLALIKLACDKEEIDTLNSSY